MNSRTELVMRQWTLAQPVVSGYLVALVRDFSTRDDLLQDVAVAVLEAADRYDPARPFVGWALGIARNLVRHHYRRDQHAPMLLDGELSAQLATAFEQVSRTSREPLSHLRGCLEKLDGRARSICTLRYADDLKPAAIAKALGMRANSVAKSLQRIRDRLRTCIELATAQENHPT